MSSKNSQISPDMTLSYRNRKIDRSLVANDLVAGFRLGVQNFTSTHQSYRLGLLWVLLDPLFRAAVFSFLMIVIRGDTSPESLVIGVFTIHALNNSFSSSMNMSLSQEPFPLSHTPTFPLLISKITSDILSAVFLGLAGSSIIVLVSQSPIEVIAVIPVSCVILSVIGSGSGILLSRFVTVAKDISKIIGYLLFLGFFLQCVLYPYSMTEGYHRLILSYLPHTIIVEWCRSVASNNLYPFSILHAAQVLAIWCIPMMVGFFKFHNYRWRATSWS